MKKEYVISQRRKRKRAFKSARRAALPKSNFR